MIGGVRAMGPGVGRGGAVDGGHAVGIGWLAVGIGWLTEGNVDITNGGIRDGGGACSDATCQKGINYYLLGLLNNGFYFK